MEYRWSSSGGCCCSQSLAPASLGTGGLHQWHRGDLLPPCQHLALVYKTGVGKEATGVGRGQQKPWQGPTMTHRGKTHPVLGKTHSPPCLHCPQKTLISQGKQGQQSSPSPSLPAHQSERCTGLTLPLCYPHGVCVGLAAPAPATDEWVVNAELGAGPPLTPTQKQLGCRNNPMTWCYSQAGP